MFKAGEYWLPDGEVQLTENYRQGGWHLERLHEIVQIVKDVVGTDGLAIDGGTHAGSWTRVMAEHFNEVQSFELSPSNYACLVRNIEDWGLHNVSSHNVGLGDIDESVGLGRDTKHTGNTAGICIEGTGNCAVTSLDKFELKNVKFLKLDVEGYEEKAMVGARKMIKSSRPLIMIEHKPRLSEKYGSRTGDLNFLERMQYTEIGKWTSDRLFIPNEHPKTPMYIQEYAKRQQAKAERKRARRGR